MTHFDGLSNLVLELVADFIKSIQAIEIRILRVLSEVLPDVHDLLGGKATPE